MEGVSEHSDLQFDVAGKSRGWHTAFYYFAEHVRMLSAQGLNHKQIYDLVGDRGSYINHENPLVRKRTAAVLSRLIHSERYVEDLQRRHAYDPMVFCRASGLIAEALVDSRVREGLELIRYLEECMWLDIRRGLVNERVEGRNLSLERASSEMAMLLGRVKAEPFRSDEAARIVIESFLNILAFGFIEESLACSLFGLTPLTNEGESIFEVPLPNNAILVRYYPGLQNAVASLWEISISEAFSIGRYTDCSAIDSDGAVSRRHCLIVNEGGAWKLIDLGSSNGTKVVRNETVVYESRRGEETCFEIEYGDRIVLAGRSTYWFGAFGEAHGGLENLAEEAKW